MKVKKMLSILLLIVVFTVFSIPNKSCAYTDANNNEYYMEIDKTDVATNDIVELTLRIRVNGKIYGTQGRISYDSNLTFVEVGSTKDCMIFYKDEDSNKGQVVARDDLKAIGYSIAQDSQFDPGEYIIIKVKFKVTGLIGGNYLIKWQDYNSNGYFEVDSVAVTRTDVNNQGGGSSSNDKSVIDIIDEEINGNGGSSQGSGSGNGSDSDYSSDDEYSVDGESGSGSKSSKKSGLPATGDGFNVVISIVAFIGLGVCVYRRAKKIEH